MRNHFHTVSLRSEAAFTMNFGLLAVLYKCLLASYRSSVRCEFLMSGLLDQRPATVKGFEYNAKKSSSSTLAVNQ